jgi:hypothetical protein
MNRALQLVLGVIVLVLVAAGSFYGGMIYGKGQAQTSVTAARQRGTPPAFVQGGQFPGQGRQGGANQRQGGMLFGQIKEIGGNFLIVTDANGRETRVLVTDTTLIEKYVSVKLSDLAVGETVFISGSRGEDGSVTARSLQVSPGGRLGPGAEATSMP